MEAILNSRPLGAMSSDPNDYRTFTHDGTVPVPDPLHEGPRLTLQQRWTLVQHIQKHFWADGQKRICTQFQFAQNGAKTSAILNLGT